ncbi:MAG: phosphate ABC transporter substrate-binding protein [Bacillota bacterium]
MKSFFKTGLYLLVSVLLVFSLVGCSSTDEVVDESNGDEDVLTGTITIAGSTSVQPVSELLAEEFMALHPGTTVYVQGGGSSTGIKAADEGAAEIGASSRELKTEEKALNEVVLAKDGIAIVVHPSSTVEDLTLEQIRDIYAGVITNWKEVGGPDKAIVVVTREEGSGTRSAFEEIVMGKDNPISDQAIVQNSTGSVKTTVAGDENAIGYISLSALNADVAAVKVDGAAISVETIISGTYKVSRPFIYVTKGEPQGLAKAYLEFAISAEAQAIIEEAGLVSIY